MEQFCRNISTAAVCPVRCFPNHRSVLKQEFPIHSVRNKEHIDAFPIYTDFRDDLCICLYQINPIHVKMERQNRVFIAGNSNFPRQLLMLQPQRNLLILPIRKRKMILIIIQEQKPSLSIRSHRVTQRISILRFNLRRPFGKNRLQRTEPFSKLIHKIMDAFQSPVGFPDLSEFPKGCLIVIGNSGNLTFVHERPIFSKRVASSLKHVVAEEIAAGCNLDIRHGVHAFERILEAVIITAGHSPSHLTAGIGPAFRLIGWLEIAGASVIIVVIILIYIFLCGWMLSLMRIENPWTERISSPQRYHAVRRCRSSPAGTGIKYRIQTALCRKRL